MIINFIKFKYNLIYYAAVNASDYLILWESFRQKESV